MVIENPPYVDAYGQLKNLFGQIKEASVPTKFNNDFLSTMLNLKSSSYRPMIPFLKRLGFLDQANVPTKIYSDFRDPTKSEQIMAQQIKIAYDILFKANAYANKLKKEDVMTKLISILGVSKEDITVPKIASSFIELCKLANFEDELPKLESSEQNKEETNNNDLMNNKSFSDNKLGISYTINLNLPATNDVEVFNAIFKSLKDNLLK